MDFQDAVVNGIPLVLVIMGLVEFAKKLGLKGVGCVVLSLCLGLAFGCAYQISAGGLPVDFPGWFSLIVYGLGLGLVTSGLWDATRSG